MILIIDINEEDYKRVKSNMLDDSLPSIIARKRIIQAIDTGILFDFFQGIATDRINKGIEELNKDLSNQLRCKQCMYNNIPGAGECYLCVKGIQDCFTPEGENK